MFDLLVVNDRRIGSDCGIQELDLLGAFESGLVKQAGKCLLKGYADSFRKGITDQNHSAPRWYQRHGPSRAVLEAEAVRIQPVGAAAPDIITGEAGG